MSLPEVDEASGQGASVKISSMEVTLLEVAWTGDVSTGGSGTVGALTGSTFRGRAGTGSDLPTSV
jgi:hypothetical protein